MTPESPTCHPRAYKDYRDVTSGHTSIADESISLGLLSQEGGNPYLNAQALIKVALKTKADAIHPGYGYLSENAAFANAVVEAGIIFIGPTSSAMSTLGDKRSAKDFLRRTDSSIPLIPGFAGASQDALELERIANKIGFPVMLKASAGGGGKGMRIVRKQSDLQAELRSAQSEAKRSFGSGDCILEKYIEAGKHIEIQILGDSHGNVVSLHERECSIQRRHQKIIEETPSPWLVASKRREMSEAAIRIGKLLHYENAGTVEFVVDANSGEFYFLEVNTRLQVEHPITEEVTGLDVVSLQLFVAAGGSLTDLAVLRQIPQVGHAIECRLCAEDPRRDFLPEHGTIRLWQEADKQISPTTNVRYETAVESGAQITIHFDPMIAKVVVWAPTRSVAISNMVHILANTACIGVLTNQLFLQSCLLHPGFQDRMYTTSFVASNLASLLRNPYVDYTPELTRKLSIFASLFGRNPGLAHLTSRPFGGVRTGFRNQIFDNVNVHTDVVVTNLSDSNHAHLLTHNRSGYRQAEGDRVTVMAVPEFPERSEGERSGEAGSSVASKVAARYNLISGAMRQGTDSTSETYKFKAKLDRVTTTVFAPSSSKSWLCGNVAASVDGTMLRGFVATDGCQALARSMMQKAEALRVSCHFPLLGEWVDLRVYTILAYCESLRQQADVEPGSSKQAVAPMPCKVISILKKAGESTKAGEPVMVVESMKMEMNISVSTAGKFEAMVREGEAVDEGTVLCVLH